MSPELQVAKRARAMQRLGADPLISVIVATADVAAAKICCLAADDVDRDVGLTLLLDAFAQSIDRFRTTHSPSRVQ